MDVMPNPAICDIAIVGGGAGGVLAALHALRQARTAAHIVLIEPAARLAEGVAYASGHAEHRLNVPVRGMSAFADQPGDFLDHLASESLDIPRDALAGRFVERRRFAEYLRHRLAQARQASPALLRILPARVVGLDREQADGTTRIRLDDGTVLSARGVVLAIGNRPRPLPVPVPISSLPVKLIPAWDFDAVKRIDPDADVCIVGAGLSMADAVLSLADNGHRGRLHVLSRHALLPLPHAADNRAADVDAQALLGLTLRQRLSALRMWVREAEAAGLPWQSVFERLRPHGQALWQSLDAGDQRRFLRHAMRYWDIHRHRIAPDVHRRIDALRASGQLQLHRGRLDRVQAQGARTRLDYGTADGRNVAQDVDVLVNATGVEWRTAAMRDPLLDRMLADGLARPGPHGIGIDTAADGRVLDAEGTPHPRWLALGSLRIGTLWESLAVPELRTQAEAAARALLA